MQVYEWQFYIFFFQLTWVFSFWFSQTQMFVDKCDKLGIPLFLFNILKTQIL